MSSVTPVISLFNDKVGKFTELHLFLVFAHYIFEVKNIKQHFMGQMTFNSYNIHYLQHFS